MTTTQAWIIATGIMLAGALAGVAQQTGPALVNGCVYLAAPPTLSDRQSQVFTCDSTGKLRVTTTF